MCPAHPVLRVRCVPSEEREEREGVAKPHQISSSLHWKMEKAEDFILHLTKPSLSLTMMEQRIRLPIYASKRQILYLIENTQVTVVVGATGSGKTTQIPQYLHEVGYTKDKLIACTQPRRVAATSVASRVADEMQCNVGEVVGYAVRFNDVTSEDTRIKYMTDGLLVREMLLDPLLLKYSVIMVDEAHERSLHTDILMAMLKKIVPQRPDLRIIVSSATLDAELFRDFFSDLPRAKLDTVAIMSLQGRMFPVQTLYLAEPCTDYVLKAVETVSCIHKSEPPGDVLVFLTGKEEIDRACQQLQQVSSTIVALPLHGSLSQQEQMLAFEPVKASQRKVILATNVAEASVTIDGIVYVVDCGFVKLKSYDVKTNTSRLGTTSTSLASAQQRAGRAGRTRPGKCFRLYTRQDFIEIVQKKVHEVPEICRTELHPTLLLLKALGVENLAKVQFVTQPPRFLLTKGLEILHGLACLDDWGRLTTLGERVAELPLKPEMAVALLKSMEYGCMEEMLTIAAMLDQDVFGQNVTKQSEMHMRKFATFDGDFITDLNVYLQWIRHRPDVPNWSRRHGLIHGNLVRAREARRQLNKYMERFFGTTRWPSIGDNAQVLKKCIVTGFFANAARLQMDGKYRTVKEGVLMEVHPLSCLSKAKKPEYIVFNEAIVSGDRTFVRGVCEIDAAWLTEIAPSFYAASGYNNSNAVEKHVEW